MAEDFDERIDMIPVSDPNVFSQAQRIVMAQTKLQLAGAAPEIHNMYEVYRDMYDALGVKDIDRIMKARYQNRDAAHGPCTGEHRCAQHGAVRAFEGQDHQAHIMSHMVFGSTPMAAGMPAVAMALQKHIMEHVQISARERLRLSLSRLLRNKDLRQIRNSG